MLQNLKTIKLEHRHISEIFRQIFELIDRDFKNFTMNVKNLNLNLIFTELPNNQHCIDELTQVVTEVALLVFFKLQEYKLLHNYLPEAGFPFFIEHISTNSAYLRLDDSHSVFPY